MEQYERTKRQVREWWVRDENKKPIYYISLVLFCLVQTLDTSVLAYLASMRDDALIYFFSFAVFIYLPGLTATTFFLQDSSNACAALSYVKKGEIQGEQLETI
jgi:polyferredoxin